MNLDSCSRLEAWDWVNKFSFSSCNKRRKEILSFVSKHENERKTDSHSRLESQTRLIIAGQCLCFTRFFCIRALSSFPLSDQKTPLFDGKVWQTTQAVNFLFGHNAHFFVDNSNIVEVSFLFFWVFPLVEKISFLWWKRDKNCKCWFMWFSWTGVF